MLAVVHVILYYLYMHDDTYNICILYASYYVYISYTYCCIYIIYVFISYIHVLYLCCDVGWYLCIIFVFVFSICSTNFCVRSCINHDENRPPSPRQHRLHPRFGIPTPQGVPRIGNTVKPTPRAPLPHSKIPMGSASCTNVPTMSSIYTVGTMGSIPLLDKGISRYGNRWDHVTAPSS